MTAPYLTRDQARSIDIRAVDEFAMNSLVLMENAGRGVTDVLCELGIGGPVAICCGKGNNGGDGFVIARHLELRGHDARVILLCPPQELRGDARANYRIIERAGTPVAVIPAPFEPDWLRRELADADWVVDAILGTGSRGNARPPFDQVIRQLNEHNAKKLAIDLPSGLDCDTGELSDPTFRADHTCTFVAPKRGFQTPQAAEVLGNVRVIDIGVPRKLLDDTSLA